MASAQHVLLSPAELAYLHTSLSLRPPIRPDGRAPTQFRPLAAETGILPGTNGSARVCFADGTEAIVGVKAEVAPTVATVSTGPGDDDHHHHPKSNNEEEEEGGGGEEDAAGAGAGGIADDDGDDVGCRRRRHGAEGKNEWVELTVEIPGYRDDDSTTVFLAQMLSEALLADGEFTRKLVINRRFHWKLYLDILLISPPLSYPLPLLSLTAHLALLASRLPRLKSERDEDPLFDDDWAASTFLYPRQQGKGRRDGGCSGPPVTLLVMAVGGNIIFDPAMEELAVAEVALAVSVGDEEKEEEETMSQHGRQKKKNQRSARGSGGGDGDDDTMDTRADGGSGKTGRSLRLLSVRTIDPPSRLTPPGVPNAANTAYGAVTVGASAAAGGGGGSGGGAATQARQESKGKAVTETEPVEGVWRAPRGGSKVAVMAALVRKVLENGGVADEVLDGLEAVELG